MTNPAIMGSLVYGQKPRKGNPKTDLVEIPDFFPAILSREEWARLQERLNIQRENPRGKVHSSEYLLSGIARCGHCGGPMIGKVGYAHKGKRYRNYYCSRATRSRGLCPVYNGHSVPKLEKTILEYLGQFSDPEKVREYITAAQEEELKRKEGELKLVKKRLADLDLQFLNYLDLLNRGVLNEDEFAKANNASREEKKSLEGRKDELTTWLEREHAQTSLVEQMPGKIKTFVEAFQGLDISQRKAQLQTILKTRPCLP